MKKLLVISTTRTQNATTMVDYLRKQMPHIQVDYTSYAEMICSFIDGQMSVLIENTNMDLSDYEVAYFKSSVIATHDVTAAYVQYALRHGVEVTDPAKAVYPGVSKLYTYSILVNHDVALPDTIFMVPSRLISGYDQYAKTLGLPFVLKGIHASRGDTNEVVRSRDDFDRIAMAAASGTPNYLIGQKFIPNEGDLRILVLGGVVQLVIHRQRADDTTHLNNTSQGGTAKLIPVEQLPKAVIAASQTAAEVLGLGIAGVDMVQNKDSQRWYCFEVNEGPQMATGSYRQEKRDILAHYLTKKVEK